jgi:deoxyhypusine synthase
MSIDLSKIRRYSIAKRKSKVNLKNFARPGKKGISFRKFYDLLPDILVAKNFRYVVDKIVLARKRKKPVIFMCGAHVIKCGLNPLLIDLIKKRIISCIALNGAGIIHDFEIALCGNTSENVDNGLVNGSFGMSKDTADFLNATIREGNREGLGIGEAVGKYIALEKLKFKNYSLLYACYRYTLPATVHVAVGTDVIHQHPSADGASIGEASLRDFRKLTEVVSNLGNGGVVVNLGSAVVLPEVFLKALNLARNLGKSVCNFTAVNFDMFYHYRPHQNVVLRPLKGERAKGYYILGHHEIMIPLLYQAILEKI